MQSNTLSWIYLRNYWAHRSGSPTKICRGVTYHQKALERKLGICIPVIHFLLASLVGTSIDFQTLHKIMRLVISIKWKPHLTHIHVRHTLKLQLIKHLNCLSVRLKIMRHHKLNTCTVLVHAD